MALLPHFRGLVMIVACIPSGTCLSQTNTEAPRISHALQQSLGVNHNEALHAGVTSDIVLLGFIGIGEEWQVVLRELSDGQTALVSRGGNAFGYQVTSIVPEADSVLLQAGDIQIELHLGTCCSPSPPPLWIERWRQEVAQLPLIRQEEARQQMRANWKGQWVSGLGQLVGKLPVNEQVEIRSLIRTFWQP